MQATLMPTKDPENVEPYYIIWCDMDGTNSGASSDDGELQGATISTATWTVPSGITTTASGVAAVTIRGVSYAANTVTTIWLSGGTDRTNYDISCLVTLSDGRILDKTITIPVRSH